MTVFNVAKKLPNIKATFVRKLVTRTGQNSLIGSYCWYIRRSHWDRSTPSHHQSDQRAWVQSCPMSIKSCPRIVSLEKWHWMKTAQKCGKSRLKVFTTGYNNVIQTPKNRQIWSHWSSDPVSPHKSECRTLVIGVVYGSRRKEEWYVDHAASLILLPKRFFWHVISVTGFGEIPPLCQKFRSLWKLLSGL